jgi:hypothetical protein
MGVLIGMDAFWGGVTGRFDVSTVSRKLMEELECSLMAKAGLDQQRTMVLVETMDHDWQSPQFVDRALHVVPLIGLCEFESALK